MGYHNNNNKEECWSCEFFCGERKHKNGFILGDSTETSATGTCSCKESSYYNKSIKEADWCSKYQKWGVLASIISKKEAEDQIKNLRLKQEYERLALERERLALEQERKRLEYERWYSSLSLEEREKEDRIVEENRRRAEKDAEEQRRRKEIEEKKRLKKKAVKKVLIIIALIAIIAIIGIVVGTVVSSMKVEGTYYLTLISGTGEVSANKNDNYLTLEDGICTLHFNTTSPVVHETFTYYYSGNLTSSIEFYRDNIHMDWKDRVVIRLDYDNGKYNEFTYEKKK